METKFATVCGSELSLTEIIDIIKPEISRICIQSTSGLGVNRDSWSTAGLVDENLTVLQGTVDELDERLGRLEVGQKNLHERYSAQSYDKIVSVRNSLGIDSNGKIEGASKKPNQQLQMQLQLKIQSGKIEKLHKKIQLIMANPYAELKQQLNSIESDKAVEKIRIQIDDLLNDHSDLPAQFVENMKCLKRLNWELFDTFWNRVSPGQPLDYSQVTLGSGVNQYGNAWKGLVSKETGERQGVFRCITDKCVGFASRLDDLTTQGLCIEVRVDEFKIGIVERNQEKFYLAFDKHGHVSRRSDQESKFPDVHPHTFLLNDQNNKE